MPSVVNAGAAKCVYGAYKVPDGDRHAGCPA